MLARVAEVMLGPDVSPLVGSGVKAATDMFARVAGGSDGGAATFDFSCV